MRSGALRALLLFALLAPLASAADEALWALLKKGGQVVLIRHAATDPGVGDPPGFSLHDCLAARLQDATQPLRGGPQGGAAPRRRVPRARHFTGVSPATAELVIVTPEGGESYRLAGRIPLAE